ncbi:MAG TPA: hypothetical protein PKA06_15540, partial [Gemmatales bacterium]|nr:hypothetical protein [Gemmatales bacterium]
MDLGSAGRFGTVQTPSNQVGSKTMCNDVDPVPGSFANFVDQGLSELAGYHPTEEGNYEGEYREITIFIVEHFDRRISILEQSFQTLL